MIGDLKKVFGIREEEPPFVAVFKGKHGIETYVDPSIDKFPKAYQKQIISFLEGVVIQLKK